jgi:hypothetical protein
VVHVPDPAQQHGPNLTICVDGAGQGPLPLTARTWSGPTAAEALKRTSSLSANPLAAQ